MLFRRSADGRVQDYSRIFPQVQSGIIRDVNDLINVIDTSPKDGFISLEEFNQW